MNKTKIVCTIGPSSNTYEKIVELIHAGMNVARLNFSHGDYDSHLEVINQLKKARKDLNRPLAIMLDNKGPEVRVGRLDQPVSFKAKDRLLLTEKKDAEPNHISIHPFQALSKVKPGVRILFDDGYITSRVVEVGSEGIWVEIENEGTLSSNKGVNVPKVVLDLPILTEKDIQDIEFGCKQDIDILAASFIRSAEHVLQIKELLKKCNRSDVLVISKIENHEGINHFDQILKVSDGIMVARGDLGVEVPLSHVPRLQKEMIAKCLKAGKPSITATQMLESMIHNPRPTRAEVSDVANAIYDATSCVMLSGESAAGLYPVESVKVLTDVIADTEAYFNYQDFFYSRIKTCYKDVPSAVTSAAVNTAYTTEAKAIFVYTSSGSTPKLMSKWLSSIPMIALTQNEKVYHQLALSWGIIPIYHPSFKSMSEAFEIICEYAIKHQIVSLGDRVVVSSGSPFGISGSTNMMVVQNIGKVLMKGKSGYGQPVSQQIMHLNTYEGIDPESIQKAILVLKQCDNQYLPLLKNASGVVLDNSEEDLESEKYLLLAAKTLNISVIVRAEGAFQKLADQAKVNLDPQSCSIYDA